MKTFPTGFHYEFYVSTNYKIKPIDGCKLIDQIYFKHMIGRLFTAFE